MARLSDPWHVLAVKSAARTSEYFQTKLGFEEFLKVDEDGWRFVRRDSCVIMLGTCPDDVDARETGCHSYFAYWHVDDPDALFEEWSASGAMLMGEPTDKEWGMREFGVTTPDGHRIMVGKSIR